MVASGRDALPRGAWHGAVHLCAISRAGRERGRGGGGAAGHTPSREEPGCLSIHAFRSTRDPRLFYIHSRWTDEAAFESHAGMPHTVRFIERVTPLIDHPFDVNRVHTIG